NFNLILRDEDKVQNFIFDFDNLDKDLDITDLRENNFMTLRFENIRQLKFIRINAVNLGTVQFQNNSVVTKINPFLEVKDTMKKLYIKKLDLTFPIQFHVEELDLVNCKKIP